MRGVVTTGGCVALAVLGIFTLGLTWLFGLLGTWKAVFRMRQSGAPAVFVRRMAAWRVLFIVLTAIAVLFWALVAVGAATQANESSTSSGPNVTPPQPGSFTIPTTPELAMPGESFRTVRWGSTVTMTDSVGAKNASVPFTLGVSNLRYPTKASMGPGANGNATVRLRICSTTATVDPGLIVVVFALDGQGNHRYGSLEDTPTPFLDNMPAGECRSARLVFRLPSGAKVTGGSYAPVNPSRQGVTWTGS